MIWPLTRRSGPRIVPLAMACFVATPICPRHPTSSADVYPCMSAVVAFAPALTAESSSDPGHSSCCMPIWPE